ncbi:MULTISPECIES: hypothetical protein [Clostridium]|uniref:Phage protein n=1 Tax=Clostridium disporicum TaxID=84024 RepID=A0A174HKY6_9CLOT|nr:MULTISPECIES: hypothetical protein [Clostridium]CUO75603.1 Uncharacterised protein [Clostridium disporicum]SCJ47599.1 Uncharacterised protein [uncultured Clostridium sp.]
MVKLQVKYENEAEKEKVIKVLSKGCKVIKVSDTYKKGKYNRIYVDIK